MKLTKKYRVIRGHIRNYLCGMTVAEMQTTLTLANERGDTFYAVCVEEFMLKSLCLRANNMADKNGNIDCVGCKGCTDCVYCSDCTDCVGCIDCVDCTNCETCDTCSDCNDCMVCENCENCNDCWDGFQRRKITGAR